MIRGVVFACCVWLGSVFAASAQETFWVQIEAQPSLREAEARVRSYSARLPDVAGFQLSSRWYGIALGPYTRPAAQAQLSSLQAEGLIPADSFLADGSGFSRQFWPVGADGLTSSPQTIVAAAQPAPELVPGEETPSEARAAENLLTIDEKQLLQTALQAEGFYDSIIDGLFGRGTRASMEAWQIANGFEPTGILTTAQRAALIESYNSILEGLGMSLTTDVAAGIEMVLPMAQLRFKEYEVPFAHYESAGSERISLSLISQEGGRARFEGLYSVLQTLDAVPTEGPRSIGADRFQITGTDGDRHTTIDARLVDGTIKGFMLVWPAGDEKRLARVLTEMRASFVSLPNVLDSTVSPPDESQSIDLLAGLEIRKPQTAVTGFFVDGRGSVLTAAETLGSCERISIGDETDADVVFADPDLGLALLRPQQSIAPMAYATFQSSVPRLNDEVAVAGFSFGGDLGAPTLTVGELADLRGLEGEDTEKRLVLQAEPGDSGGPVFDQGGAVLGLLRPAPEREGQILPQTVRFAIDADTIRTRLAAEGVAISEVSVPAIMDPVELSALAADIAVLVKCW